jgi:Cu/Ag efflux pump CusA
MIPRLIEYSIRNRFIVILLTAMVALWGFWCVLKTPIDAIPDLSENQVIIFTDWMGRSPQEIDDQITYPLSVNLQGLAGVKVIRAQSEFNFSMITIIFEDNIDFYFARTRVLERLNIASTFLPSGVVPYLAPDATALGQIFWYTVEGDGQGVDELRAIQDWYVRYQLYVPGVAEVSTVGGLVREYQIDVDPDKLRAYNLSLGQVYDAIARGNIAVGGKVFLEANAEYLIRGIGWIQGARDLENVVVTQRDGIPIQVKNLAAVQLGPEYRRSMLEKNNREAVGGVVMMRYGENPLTVTRAIKQRIEQLQAGLPPGVRIVPFYDRTRLIEGAIDTLRETLLEELIIASLAILLILGHLRSAMVVCVTLPLAVLVSFILMYYVGIPSNIMSLSGIAISIGLFVDSAVVMVENTTHELTARHGRERIRGDTTEVVVESCRMVGKPIFFAVLIMLVSFLPVFALGGTEGKMFHPLAFTKSFAMIGVALLSVTFVPAMIPLFVKGRLRREEDSWIVRSFIQIYKPVLTWLMDVPAAGLWFMGFLFIVAAGFIGSRALFLGVLALGLFFGCAFFIRARSQVIAFALLIATAAWAWHFPKLGREFMPPLDEGSILEMPVTVPRVSITQAGDDIRVRDMVMRGFPEVDQVVGKAGRAATPTDPSGLDMIETIVTLRPKEWWPKRKVRFEDAMEETENVYDFLVDRGVFKSVDDRRKELRASVENARKALDALKPLALSLGAAQIAITDALNDAISLWEQVSSQPDSPLAAFPEYGPSLKATKRMYVVAVRDVPSDEKMGRAEAYERANQLLQVDFTNVFDAIIAEERESIVDGSAMTAMVSFDRAMRELARRRLLEHEPVVAKKLVIETIHELLAIYRRKRALKDEPSASQIEQLAEPLVKEHGIPLVQVPRREEMVRMISTVAARFAELGIVESSPELLLLPETAGSVLKDFVATAVGGEKSSVFSVLFERFERRLSEEWVARVKMLNWELEDQSGGTMVWSLLTALRDEAKSKGLLAKAPTDEDLRSIRDQRAESFGKSVFLWHKSKDDLVKEMDSELQMPGWGNIWTQPIINRVDMLTTGVRTMIGVKVFGPRQEDLVEEIEENGVKKTVVKEPGIQSISNEIAGALRGIRGAVDVFPDQIVGRSYLQIDIDRERAARYGVNVADIQEAIEVAMGGKTITTTVEGRSRFPVRVRYAREGWQTQDALRRTLVTGRRTQSVANAGASGTATAMSAAPEVMGTGDEVQIPISEVADIRVVEGPSVIKSENGMLRSYVQLNVRDRDIVGFVEEAQRAVADQVKLPPGFYIEWSGQFEHQVRAKKTLQIIFPLVILVMFVILYMTFNSVFDALLIMLAVPGALAGGVIFQSLFHFNFSVAVWIGYITCFGEATQTGIVMLVYLHEAIKKRGGLANMKSTEDIRQAVIEGAVHRLRPKLMTEGVAIIGLMPMLWATGVGSEVMRPMAAPVLGGMLVADEVIDLLLPVIFNWYQCRKWRRLHQRVGAVVATTS